MEFSVALGYIRLSTSLLKIFAKKNGFRLINGVMEPKYLLGLKTMIIIENFQSVGK